MIIGLKQKKNYWDELEKRLKMLEEKTVKVGVFDNSPRDDGFWTNVTLMAYLSGGDMDRNLVARPVIQLTFAANPLEKSPAKKYLKKYFSAITRKKSESDVMDLLQGIGTYYRDLVYGNFGNTAMLASNTDYTQKWKESLGYKGDNPLVLEGSLRNAISFKIDGSIWEYGVH